VDVPPALGKRLGRALSFGTFGRSASHRRGKEPRGDRDGDRDGVARGSFLYEGSVSQSRTFALHAPDPKFNERGKRGRRQ